MLDSIPTLRQWAGKRHEAVELQSQRKHQPDALIEVSSQHPLQEGMYPNDEFAKRLLKGIALRENLLSRTRGKIMLLVTGSRHREGDHVDERSLSEAGTEFLREHGVPPEYILGEDAMNQFKGPDHLWPGVYNSADEAYVAAELFKNNEEFGKIFSVVSTFQSFRKRLHYLWNGVQPTMVPVWMKHGHHSLLNELTKNIPYTFQVDPDWQSPGSMAAKNSRIQRQISE